MTGSTVNLGLTTYNVGLDGTAAFFNFVSDVSGSPPTSNMNKIDSFAGTMKEDCIEIIIGDGTSEITAGLVAYVEMPRDFTLSTVTLMANTSGSLILDIWKDTYANFPPLVGDTIIGTTKPTLADTQKYQDSALIGWTTTWLKDSIIAINVDSANVITLATLSLKGYINI